MSPFTATERMLLPTATVFTVQIQPITGMTPTPVPAEINSKIRGFWIVNLTVLALVVMSEIASVR